MDGLLLVWFARSAGISPSRYAGQALIIIDQGIFWGSRHSA